MKSCLQWGLNSNRSDIFFAWKELKLRRSVKSLFFWNLKQHFGHWICDILYIKSIYQQKWYWICSYYLSNTGIFICEMEKIKKRCNLGLSDSSVFLCISFSQVCFLCQQHHAIKFYFCTALQYFGGAPDDIWEQGGHNKILT